MKQGLHRAVLLDRDGVLNYDTGYLYRVDDIVLVEGVRQALQEIQRRGYRLVVVTNQSGIGRGLFSWDDFAQVMSWMLARFASEGIIIAGVYCCPHAPEVGCDCRKPAPGLILQAQRDLDLDLPNSWLVGDKLSDIEAAQRAGVGSTLLVGRRGKCLGPGDAKPLYVGDSLLDMIPHLEG